MLNKTQKKILLGCVLAYTCAYIGRLNVSAVLPYLTAHFSLTFTQSGLLQTVFALVYASGQFINGALSDKVNPRLYIMAGLFVSSICNLLMGVVHFFPLLLVIWGINGFAQSMLWTPIVRMIALYFNERTRSKASFYLTFTMVLGHFFAWFIADTMGKHFSYQMAFIVPSFVLLLALIPCQLLLPKSVSSISLKAKEEQKGSLSALFKTGFLFLLLACIMNGFTRDGVMTWAPAVLNQMEQTFLPTVLIIPLINVFGLIFGKTLLKKSNDQSRRFLILLNILSISIILPLTFTTSPLLSALLLGITCALMYAINPVLTTILPLESDKFGLVGLSAGMMDSAIYIGSALAGVLGGQLKTVGGNQLLYISWAVACALSILFTLCSIKMHKKSNAV